MLLRLILEIRFLIIHNYTEGEKIGIYLNSWFPMSDL